MLVYVSQCKVNELIKVSCVVPPGAAGYQKNSISHKKVTPQKNYQFFRNFSLWFKMLPLLFELLYHLHKRPVQLGKGIKIATRTHRPFSKDLNLSNQKNRFVFLFFWGGDSLPKSQEKCQKGFL
jgi:hypothetical protein